MSRGGVPALASLAPPVDDPEGGVTAPSAVCEGEPEPPLPTLELPPSTPDVASDCGVWLELLQASNKIVKQPKACFMARRLVQWTDRSRICAIPAARATLAVADA
jgi:hypothetical protein